MANTVVQQRIDQGPKKAVVGYPAFPARSSNVNSRENGNGGQVAIKTLTLTFADDFKYEYSVDGEQLAFTESAEGDAATVAAAIATRDKFNPQIAKLAALTVATNVLTFTGKHEGNDFDLVAESDNLAVATTQAASEAAVMPFGRVVMDGGPAKKNASQRAAKLLDNTGLTARKIVITPGAGAATVQVHYEGETYVASGTGAGAIKTAIDGVLPASSVTTTVNGGDLEFEVATAGATFDLGINGDAVLKSIAGDDILKKIEGITCYTARATKDGYEPEAFMDVITQDGAWVASKAGDPAYDGNIWVGVEGADRGELFAERGAGRVWWNGASIGQVDGKIFQALF
jgi:hypothetical protein